MRDVIVIDQSTLLRALMAAVQVDSVCNICWLVMRGAPEISKALQVAEQEHKLKAAMVLTLIRAAQTNDCNLVASLFQDQLEGSVWAALQSGEIPMVVPLQIAHRYNHRTVREELLFRTDVLREQGTVCWHGLHLCILEPEWLIRLDWTTYLMLAWNRLQMLPEEMACLTKVWRQCYPSNERGQYCVCLKKECLEVNIWTGWLNVYSGAEHLAEC